MKSLSLLATVAVLSSTAFAEESAHIEISVSQDGTVTLAGHTMTMEELTQQLAALAKKEKLPVAVASSEHAPLEVVSKVLDACRKAGLEKIRLRTR